MHTAMDLPQMQTFTIIRTCSRCQKKAKKIFSTLIGSVDSIEVENKGNAGGKVIVKSRVDPAKFAAIIEELVKGNFNSCGGPTPLTPIEETNSYNRTPSVQENNRHTPNEQENNSHASVGQSLFKGQQGVEQLQDLIKNKKIKQLELVQNLKINFSKDKDNKPSQKGSEYDNKETPPEHKQKEVIDSIHHASNATNIGGTSKPSENAQLFYSTARPTHNFHCPSPLTTLRANNFSSGTISRANDLCGGTIPRANDLCGGTTPRVNDLYGGTPSRANDLSSGTPSRADDLSNGSRCSVQ